MKKEDNNELIGVIAAALAACDKRTGYRLVVKSFRRILRHHRYGARQENWKTTIIAIEGIDNEKVPDKS